MSKQLAEVIEQRSIPVPESGCWLWDASAGSNGYGDFRMGRHYLAHRASYIAFKGEIPRGMHVLHKCDVRLCVNPAHLFLGTNNDNIDDSVRKGRRKGVKRNRPTGLVYAKHSRESKERRRKISPEQRAGIKAAKQAGGSNSVVAKQFGVSPTAVFRIWHGWYD